MKIILILATILICQPAFSENVVELDCQGELATNPERVYPVRIRHYPDAEELQVVHYSDFGSSGPGTLAQRNILSKTDRMKYRVKGRVYQTYLPTALANWLPRRDTNPPIE